MTSLLRTTAIVSTAALLTFGMSGVGSAQTGDPNKCAYGQDNCQQGKMQNSDEGSLKKRPKVDQGMDQNKVDNGQSKRNVQITESQTHWKFDPSKHERRRHKDSRFRFEFSGFWYPAPYWTGVYGYAVSNRVSCGEGRDIVSTRGFYRVRVVECAGRAYTYLGRRHGHTFQVILSARSGRIIDVNRI